jgi:hypothetical protein
MTTSVGTLNRSQISLRIFTSGSLFTVWSEGPLTSANEYPPSVWITSRSGSPTFHFEQISWCICL